MPAKELAVVVIHGMGSQDREYAEPMIAEINSRVARLSKDPRCIAWKTIYWADILQARQDRYWRAAKTRAELDFVRLRKFVIASFGDAAAYQQVPSESNNTYEDIHARIRQGIKELYQVDLESRPRPMIVLAHSLGGHMLSNYVWDQQKRPDRISSSFERMNWLSGIVTFGCNIPLYTFAYRRVVPIRFPPSRLPRRYKSKARWYNYYDPDDVLAYPLKPINDAYGKTVYRDIAINVGGVLTSWNPASHMKYWTDNDFTVPVARFIAGFLVNPKRRSPA